jgi:SAM-dependent methyltransferase
MPFDAAQLLRTLSNAGRRAFGLAVRIDTEDRRVLERTILPAYAERNDVQRVLFVGCAPYTEPYRHIFRAVDYWTIDPVPSRARHGSEHHIVAPLQQLDRHVQHGSFDLIVCNGVLGWGLNQMADAERAFVCCETALRDGGELVIGWNDVPGRNRVRPETIAALRRFERQVCPAIGAVRMIVAGPHRHVFDFYRKRGGSRSAAVGPVADAHEKISVGAGVPGR